MKIEINSKTTCPYCYMAKEYLTQNGIEYEEHVYDDDAERQAMYDRFELIALQRSVPQIFVVENDGTRIRIGGYTDLIKSDIASRHSVGEFNMDF